MALQYPALDAAIGTAEGYGKMGTIPTLAYNPGDLVAGPFATAHGATGSVLAAGGQQIAVFPDVATGMAAEDALIAGNYAGGTVGDIAAGWLAGSSPTDQANWTTNVTNALGLPSSTPVSQTAAPASASTGATPSWWDRLKTATVQSAIDVMAPGLGLSMAATTTPGTPASTGFSWGRIAAFLLGLIVIAAALYLFKPVQQAVGGTVRNVERVVRVVKVI